MRGHNNWVAAGLAQWDNWELSIIGTGGGSWLTTSYSLQAELLSGCLDWRDLECCVVAELSWPDINNTQWSPHGWQAWLWPGPDLSYVYPGLAWLMRSQILIWLGRCRVPFSPASHRLVLGLWYLKTCTQPPHWLPPVNTPSSGPTRPGLAFPVECEGWDWLGARWRDEITIRLGPSLQTQDKQGICGRETDMLSSHSHCPWLVSSEHDGGLQWQWQPGEAQQQRLPHRQPTHCWGEDREMWNIKTNSNPTSRQETLADPSDGANTSAAPSNT